MRAIELMARYDAVAALRLAELCKMPLLKENPRFLIKNAEQPAFLGQIVQRALGESPRRGVVGLRRNGIMLPGCAGRTSRERTIDGFGAGDPSAARFWNRLFGMKQSLFTQIFGRIAQFANNSARLDKDLPHSVRRFTV